MTRRGALLARGGSLLASAVASAAVAAALLAGPSLLHAQALTPAEELARQAVVRRTAYGVPHIRAETLEAGYYAMGWVQTEDYGLRVPGGLVAAWNGATPSGAGRGFPRTSGPPTGGSRPG